MISTHVFLNFSIMPLPNWSNQTRNLELVLIKTRCPFHLQHVHILLPNWSNQITNLELLLIKTICPFYLQHVRILNKVNTFLSSKQCAIASNLIKPLPQCLINRIVPAVVFTAYDISHICIKTSTPYLQRRILRIN